MHRLRMVEDVEVVERRVRNRRQGSRTGWDDIDGNVILRSIYLYAFTFLWYRS